MEKDTCAIASSALVRALDRLRSIHPDMTIQQALSFFLVAGNPGTTQRAIQEALGTHSSVASRTVAILSDVGNRNTPGLGLIEMEVNPEDRRERLLRPSPRGRRLMDAIVRDLGLDRARGSPSNEEVI